MDIRCFEKDRKKVKAPTSGAFYTIGLKIRWGQPREGSSPSSGTSFSQFSQIRVCLGLPALGANYRPCMQWVATGSFCTSTINNRAKFRGQPFTGGVGTSGARSFLSDFRDAMEKRK